MPPRHRRSGARHRPPALYVPNLIGTPDRIEGQLAFAARAGVQAVMVSPMLVGLPLLHQLATAPEGFPIIAHPSLGGVLRAREAALFGKIFRWYGADAVIFPHAGGRFRYGAEVCRDLAEALREPHPRMRPAFPVPAGGIRVDRVPELLSFYGRDCILLIGGSLYEAGDSLFERTRGLAERVARASEDPAGMSAHVRQTDPFRWEGIAVSPYKADGTHFSGITRQLLFDGGNGLDCQLRYFEIEPGGYSSLERHHHAHAIMVVRGPGRAFVGDAVIDMAVNDLVRVPPLTWHQFRAGEVPFGFLCVVDCARDVPQRPDAATLNVLKTDPAIAAFIRT